ncbi:modulator of macroautophagy TMEM150B [Echinops telfairi]|uniref:Modulator of macroautophagy TMEM150B n=1 Tax=Echinops telfairi TaxID=9371 RepID=A0ABM0J675_ECHTE|nr:modulator of macroautophagy TMEM150B [Echinops telfairi]
MWGHLALLPIFLALWAVAGTWTVFSLAVLNQTVNLTKRFPYISACGSDPPQSCLFSQVLNVGAAVAAWIFILRYHQLRDWGVRRGFNLLILWAGLLSAVGTSVVGNFQQKNLRPVHLTGSFFAFAVGTLYFWLQLLLLHLRKDLPRPGPPWLGLLRLLLCTACTILMVVMTVLHRWRWLRSASAGCEWTVAMLLFTLAGLLAFDFSLLDSCTLCLRTARRLGPPPPVSPSSLREQHSQETCLGCSPAGPEETEANPTPGPTTGEAG